MRKLDCIESEEIPLFSFAGEPVLAEKRRHKSRSNLKQVTENNYHPLSYTGYLFGIHANSEI